MRKILRLFNSFRFNLQYFANHVNVTTDGDLSPEMKTYYDMTLIDEAGPLLIHDQFGQKRPIPAGSGKEIEFRRFAPLPKALVPLTEGKTPDGKTLKVTSVKSEVHQFGDYITQSDVLELTSIDNTIVEATKLLGRQAGLTLDTVTRNILHAGTNVHFCSKWSGTTEVPVTSRKDLDGTAKLSIDIIKQIVAKLRTMNAPTINGKYVAIIHPYVAYDIMSDPAWIDCYKYAQPTNLFEGEIGELAGVRFVESSEAKVYRGAGLTEASRTLKLSAAVSASTTVTVDEKITADDVAAFAARADEDKYVYANGEKLEVSALVAGAAGAASLTLAESATIADDTVLYPYGGTAEDLAVFGTLFIADGAYGVTEIEGGGLETIVKQKGSGGTSDPLNQRSSVAWKALKTAEILIGNYLIRCESVSARFSSTSEEN